MASLQETKSLIRFEFTCPCFISFRAGVKGVLSLHIGSPSPQPYYCPMLACPLAAGPTLRL